jgi:hypothetical protein
VTRVSATPTVYFHEDQRFRGSMPWLLIAIFLLGAVLVLASVFEREPAAALLTVAIFAAVLGIFLVARLETEVRSDAVVVHFHGLWPTRRVPLNDVATFEPLRYTMWQSGGWGVHLGLAGMTYNVSGNEGLHFRLKNGSGVLVGTQRPQEFAAAVAKALEARRAR